MRHFDLMATDVVAADQLQPGLYRQPGTLGSAVLHLIKLVLGRRRPRDDMEMGLYGFMPLAFNPITIPFPAAMP